MANSEQRAPAFWSMYYLAGYLSTTGIALLFVPVEATRLLGATGNYDHVMTRASGSFMIALSVLVTQIIRHRLEVLKRTTLFIRFFFLSVFASFYVSTRDPIFITILGVVSFGVLLTIVELYREGKNPLSLKGI